MKLITNYILGKVALGVIAKASLISVSWVWLFTGASLANDHTVTWATEDFPPFYITEGEIPGTIDRLIELISAHMPDYDHSTEFVPILRIIEQLRDGDNIVCASFLYDPKIENIAQYSNVLFDVPPLELALSRTKWEQLGKPEKVSLGQLIASNDLVLGISDGRNYGPELTSLIDNAPTDALFVRTGDHFKGLAQMIDLGRINATIAYKGEVEFYKVATNSNAIVSVAVEENPNTLPVYAVVPRTKWGDIFLSDFNSALAVAKKDPGFSLAISNWFE